MKDMEINISLTDSGKQKIRFTSLKSLRDFCNQEHDFWLAKKKSISESGISSKDIPNQFSATSLLIQLVDWIDGAQESVAEGGASWVQQQIQQRYQNINRNLAERWLYSKHPYTQVFIDCFTQHGLHAADAFLLYTQQKHSQIPSNMSFDQLKGYIVAYEFENQDSDLVKRRKGERQAIGRVRNDFVDAKDRLFGEVAGLKAEYENLSAKAKQELTDELERWQEERKENGEQFDQVLAQYQKSISDAIEDHHSEIDAMKQTTIAKIKALEEKYEEKLRLEPAAKYWNKSARRLMWQGIILVGLIIVMVVAGLREGIHLFDLWLSNEKLPINLASLQGVLITITVLAIYAYLLRILSRMTFSSFHLMRDAEEREQLTYLYLALSNEAKVDEKSREIVLQALFSRSETGLLTNEHGPTMPGIDMNQLLKGIGR